MRFTSSALRAIALLLSASLLLEAGRVTAAVTATESAAEPCLLLRFSAPSSVSDRHREITGRIAKSLEKHLNVNWVAVPAPGTKKRESVLPEADDTSLRRISNMLADSGRMMEAMETRAALSKLSEAETEARGIRIGDATRPLLAEIFLKKGLIRLWDGDRNGAERHFARSRVMRPDFKPDPALFSPQFREAWNRAGERPPPEAEVLVHSIPSGAEIAIDGVPKGRTPARVAVSSKAPARIRVSLAGYLPEESVGQWLPGDTETIEVTLSGDRMARLAELLASGQGAGDAGPLIAEIASDSGAKRVALMVAKGEGERTSLSVLSSTVETPAPVLIGGFDLAEGEEGETEASARIARMLVGAGWPSRVGIEADAEAPWYHKWWVWVVLGVALAGAAAGMGGGGGGGSSGSSTGSIGVNF